MFTQPFIQAQIKENIQALRHWPLWGEFTGDRWIPHTKGQKRRNCFHLMTASWESPSVTQVRLNLKPTLDNSIRHIRRLRGFVIIPVVLKIHYIIEALGNCRNIRNAVLPPHTFQYHKDKTVVQPCYLWNWRYISGKTILYGNDTVGDFAVLVEKYLEAALDRLETVMPRDEEQRDRKLFLSRLAEVRLHSRAPFTNFNPSMDK